MLLAVFLLVGGVGAPAFARDDMSNGQTGDPGDGSEVAASGGSGTPVASGQSGASAEFQFLRHTFILVPVFSNGILVFQLIVIANRDAMRQ
jgi:hypothetical protein